MPHSAPTLHTEYQPPTALHSHGLTLFCDILQLASEILFALCRRFTLTNFEGSVIPTTARVIKCLGAMLAIRLTLLRVPERITPRQILRLARAAHILQRLTGRSLDFTPWTTLTPEELEVFDQFNPSSPSCKPVSSLQSSASVAPFSAVTSPHLAGIPTLPVLNALAACPQLHTVAIRTHPGAALANFCRDLIRLIPRDFVLDGNTAISSPTSQTLNNTQPAHLEDALFAQSTLSTTPVTSTPAPCQFMSGETVPDSSPAQSTSSAPPSAFSMPPFLHSPP